MSDFLTNVTHDDWVEPERVIIRIEVRTSLAASFAEEVADKLRSDGSINRRIQRAIEDGLDGEWQGGGTAVVPAVNVVKATVDVG